MSAAQWWGVALMAAPFVAIFIAVVIDDPVGAFVCFGIFFAVIAWAVASSVLITGFLG